jgi:hypothetical protein
MSERDKKLEELLKLRESLKQTINRNDDPQKKEEIEFLLKRL